MASTSIRVTISFKAEIDTEDFDPDGNYEGTPLVRFKGYVDDCLTAEELLSEYPSSDPVISITPA